MKMFKTLSHRHGFAIVILIFVSVSWSHAAEGEGELEGNWACRGSCPLFPWEFSFACTLCVNLGNFKMKMV